ncbi:helix-turn-helix transcriptional regulator [Paenibacillus sp. LHD-117]|uniref:helix-turn-helix transcriptional regulator n=1 Tax=Paenibacillus sp. LHD-117 TaxID=3071412 RepID=UPI0027E12EE6|nr:helix-turn-helix transcriptional regulator [Paenibacillus sp. LHD-117]MDQ6423460.1 helix-turn-helix transcriptional regulator [Paenibacillus sp. LHD-117]
MVSGYRPIQSPKLQQELQHDGYRYREYAPSARLAGHVACYWTVDIQAGHGEQPHRILPDGCVDIIIDRRSPASRNAGFVAGLMTQYELLSFSETQSSFGIRFFSESAQSVLQVPLSSFIGHHVFLEEIWGAEGLLMAEEILSADTVSEIITIADRNLLRILAAYDEASETLSMLGMKYIYAYKGSITTADLAWKLSYSERHLRRVFERELGVSPKEMLGIVRFQSMLQELYNGTFSSLADLATKYGYYDQSHFIKSFKRYYGLLPTQTLGTDERSPIFPIRTATENRIVWM